jgi:hypothetical protein
VKDRFGEVNVLFALDLLVDGVVRAFNRTLDWVGSLIPVPGLDSLLGFVKAVLSSATTYVDETIFSYNLARGDENVFRSSKDGLIYYAQNAKEILKTAVWVVVLEKVLSVAIFLLIFLPILGLASMVPSSLGIWPTVTAIVVGLLLASNVQQALLHPLFVTMVIVRFHVLTSGQAINLEWDRKLEAVSAKFGELKDKASGWLEAPTPGTTVSPAPAAAEPLPQRR